MYLQHFFFNLQHFFCTQAKIHTEEKAASSINDIGQINSCMQIESRSLSLILHKTQLPKNQCASTQPDTMVLIEQEEIDRIRIKINN